MNRLRRLIACLLVVAFAGMPAELARADIAAPAQGYGFGAGAAMTYQPLPDVNRELDAVSATGASWLRILVDWNRIELQRGVYDWTQLDGVVDAARRHNLEILAVIAYSAPWARPAGTYFTAFPTDPADFARFASAVVARYGDRISHWQLWNEPNLPLFSGFADIDGTDYVRMLAAAFPAIKSVQPDSTVVAAALSRKLGDGSPPAFLAQVYAAGGKGLFDAAAAHPYVFPAGFAGDTENGWSDVARLRQLMVQNGDGDKKIWLTEFGAPTSDPAFEGVTETQQAEQITGLLAAAAATPYIGPVFIYSIRDLDTTARSDREANFGALLTSDWRPKAAAAQLAK